MSDESMSELLTDDVRELLRLVCQTDITELSLERGSVKIHVKRTPAVAPVVPQPTLTVAPGIAASQPLEPLEEDESGHLITSPMVGTYYASPSPKDAAYVNLGDEIFPGDVIGIVEAMKMMNEIECEVHGHVTAIHVENAQPVEYGQVLMTITPVE